MAFRGCEITLLARKKSDTAAAIIVTNETRMYGCLAYERVTAIDSVRDSGVLFCGCRTPNHIRLVVDLLVTHCMWIQHLHSLAIGRTSEGEGSVVKRATPVTVQATAIARIPTAISTGHSRDLGDVSPEACSTPDRLRFAITLDFTSLCRMVEHQNEGQEPAEVEERQ